MGQNRVRARGEVLGMKPSVRASACQHSHLLHRRPQHWVDKPAAREEALVRVRVRVRVRVSWIGLG